MLSKVQGLYSILPPYMISCKILRASKKGMLGREQMEFPPACMEESVSSATRVDTAFSPGQEADPIQAITVFSL